MLWQGLQPFTTKYSLYSKLFKILKPWYTVFPQKESLLFEKLKVNFENLVWIVNIGANHSIQSS